MELVVFFLPVLIKDVETNFCPHPGDRCAVSKNGEVFKESPNILFSAIAFSSTGLDC